MTYHLRGISKFFSEAPIKTALLIPYLVRGFENFLPEGLILPLSRDLPLEGEKFPATPVKMTSPIPKLVRRIFRMAKHKEKFCGVPANTPQNGSALSKYSEGTYRDQTIKKLLQGLIFCLSRGLPLEGIFISTHKIGPSQSSLSEGIYRNRPITKKFSRHPEKSSLKWLNKWRGFSGASDSLTRQGGDNHPTTE